MERSRKFLVNGIEIICSIVSFSEFSGGIKEHRRECAFKDDLPPVIHGYGLNQYLGEEIFDRVLFFPIAAHINHVPVGYFGIYNCSDECVRSAGIWVNEKFRRHGVARVMMKYGFSLWPPSVRKFLNYYRSGALGFATKVGLNPEPDFAERNNMRDMRTYAEDYKIILMSSKL